jgi:ParB family chromosome partitioning protein
MAIPFVYSYRRGSGTAERHLFPDSAEAVREIPISDIKTDGIATPQSPEDNGEMENLMASIQKRGLLQPIVVSQEPDGRFTILAGEQRLLACRRLGWKMVPAIVRRPAPPPAPNAA